MEVMAEIKPDKVLPEGTIVYHWKYDKIDEDSQWVTRKDASK
jgi:hypothetical protein